MERDRGQVTRDGRVGLCSRCHLGCRICGNSPCFNRTGFPSTHLTPKLVWVKSSPTPSLYHNPHQQYDLHQTLVSSPSHILVAQTGLSKIFLCCFFNLLTFKNNFRLTATVGKSDKEQCFSDSRHPVFLLDSRPHVRIHRAAVAGIATSLFPFYVLVIRLLIDCRYLQIIVYISDSFPLLYCRFHRL